MKTKLPFTIKLSFFLAFLAFGFSSCNQEHLETSDENAIKDVITSDLELAKSSTGKNKKIEICHYSEEDGSWKVLEVSENAWDAHSAHGDVWLDQDNDGYTAFNECGIGNMSDCDDTNPKVYPFAYEVCDEIDNDCDGTLYSLRVYISTNNKGNSGTYALFGPQTNVSGPWVEINGPNAACSPLTEDLTGKIVLIDRGDCFLVDKVYHAQEQGAIGVVICSKTQLGIMRMPEGYMNSITIPSVMIYTALCEYLTANGEIIDINYENVCFGSFDKSQAKNSSGNKVPTLGEEIKNPYGEEAIGLPTLK